MTERAGWSKDHSLLFLSDIPDLASLRRPSSNLGYELPAGSLFCDHCRTRDGKIRYRNLDGRVVLICPLCEHRGIKFEK